MLFSLEWIRAVCPVNAEPKVIADALTSRGLTVDSLEARGADHVLDVDIPANRGDCLGHVGLARELSAAFGVALAPRPDAVDADTGAAETLMRVEIDEPSLCSRFTATVVRGVRIGSSPDWVVRRLEACGLRSINNVVDASNLVMLETGNPVHFYDLNRLRGGVIRARLASPSEKLETLDGVEHELDDDMLLIADGERSLGLAGIMGGADSEIADDTRDVLVEVAWFDPQSIRATGRKLGTKTDACFRFERNVDPNGVLDAQALSVKYLVELAGGSLEGGLIDRHPTPRPAAELTLRVDQLPRLLGFRPTDEETLGALSTLGLSPRPTEPGSLSVTVPSWRSDLGREADLVEEVARHLGYDRIPVHRTEMSVEDTRDAAISLAERARDALAHAGFFEAFGYAMIPAGEDDPFVWADSDPGPALDNPIAETMGVLRRSLLPGLCKAVELNVRRGARDVRLFEIEHVFRTPSPEWLKLGHPGLPPQEPEQIGLAWTGAASPGHWSAADRTVDLYDIAGLIELLLDSFAPGLAWTKSAESLPGFHPGRAACWKAADGERVAWCGELHPSLAGEIDQPLYLGCLDVTPLLAAAGGTPSFSRLPRLGSVNRDLAVVLPAEMPFSRLLTALERVPSPVPARFAAVDRYEGAQLGDGESSVTVRVTLQPDERTLTDDEIETFRLALLGAVADLGLAIRG